MPDPRMTFQQMIDAGWRLSVHANPGGNFAARLGPGRYGYVGHHRDGCYIEGTAKSWAELERTWHRRHHRALQNGVIHV